MKFLYLILGALLLSGCAAREVGTYYRPNSWTAPARPLPGGDGADARRTIFVTIDGTSNTLTSRTNPGRLYELVEANAQAMGNSARLVTWYAEGVGSGDGKPGGKIFGAGMSDDIKRAYAFLTYAWKPGDKLYLNGFSRGAYGVRALGGFIYVAGIPDLSGMPAKKRAKIVGALFRAYKSDKRKWACQASGSANDFAPCVTSMAAERTDRIQAVMDEYGLHWARGREPGFSHPATSATIEAMTIWDTVAALGIPDGTQSPLEGPDHYLLTSCNVRHVFHAVSLDDNRVYSFTPILAAGPKMLAACPAGSRAQRINEETSEVWFSGAHADVGGTYEFAGILDGTLPNVSYNWMLGKLRSVAPELVPEKAILFEDRLAPVHDAERNGIAGRILYRQSRKPMAYSARAYGKAGPIVIHASVLDRLEYLFATDRLFARCSGKGFARCSGKGFARCSGKGFARCSGKGIVEGPPLLCAQELASYSLVPELWKLGCLEPVDWGYRIKQSEFDRCVKVEGERLVDGTNAPRPGPGNCPPPHGPRTFTAYVHPELENPQADLDAKREPIEVDYPRCVSIDGT